MNHVGQAVYAIAQLIDEDKVRKDSEDGDDFLDDFSRCCLLNGLKVLAQVLWDKGCALEKMAKEEAK
ncbi:hypothetical protein D9M70_634790 [compost metagenome]